jgi:hypothetical protein
MAPYHRSQLRQKPDRRYQKTHVSTWRFDSGESQIEGPTQPDFVVLKGLNSHVGLKFRGKFYTCSFHWFFYLFGSTLKLMGIEPFVLLPTNNASLGSAAPYKFPKAVGCSGSARFVFIFYNRPNKIRKLFKSSLIDYSKRLPLKLI